MHVPVMYVRLDQGPTVDTAHYARLDQDGKGRYYDFSHCDILRTVRNRKAEVVLSNMHLTQRIPSIEGEFDEYGFFRAV